MKEHPILFSTLMIQALLAGRKTMTRRLAKGPVLGFLEPTPRCTDEYIRGLCPYGEIGDVLYVREKWIVTERDGQGIGNQFIVFEDEMDEHFANESAPLRLCSGYKWGGHPSIHLPKAYSRIWLQIEDVRVEKVQDISEEDAVAEGVQENICDDPSKCPSTLKGDSCCGKGEYFRYPIDYDDEPCSSAYESFMTLWQSIHGRESWDSNPWLWAVQFKVLSTTGKPAL